MVKNQVYFIKVVPFRIVEKSLNKTLIVSNKGNYKIVNSSSLVDFKEGDYLLRNMMIGNGIVQINYTKMDDEKMREDFQKKRLENLFFRFREIPFFPMS